MFYNIFNVPISGDTDADSKLRSALNFRWSESVLGVTTGREDAVHEVASMVLNVALWFMKHAASLVAKPEVKMEEAKEVHTSLRKGAGLVKFVQDTLLAQLSEKSPDGGDLDGRVCTAYINQVGHYHYYCYVE